VDRNEVDHSHDLIEQHLQTPFGCHQWQVCYGTSGSKPHFDGIRRFRS